MYLKKLEMQGFKSFADKICLEFNSGITCVVGPNGSGKSNISDAVRWVLGEQSIKALRGSKMEDIIFSGTAHRKQLGYAEVSITIDNSDNELPIAFSEVTFTRRVFRSGESEYLINKTPCRLKDISELLFDTGIGKDGYSIIGQGRIDEIISNKSEDRRHIFEEASGIMKYKVRKLESERKLEQTQQNLIRINDIITELENQIEPLREQSEAAKKFLSVRDNLKELEINVYLENLTKLKNRIADYEEQIEQSKAQVEAEALNIEELGVSGRQKTDISKQLEQKLEIVREQFYGLENNIEKFNSEIKLNEEKINNSNINIERINSEIEDIKSRIGDFEKEAGVKKQKIEYLNADYGKYAAKLKEAEDKLAEVVSSLNESERHMESLKQEILTKLDLISEIKTQKSNSKARGEAVGERVSAIKKELSALIIERDKDGMKAEDISESMTKSKAVLKKNVDLIAGLRTTRIEKENELSGLKTLQEKLNYDLQTKSSRSKTLQDMENRLEGYNRSVRAILENYEGGASSGIRGAVAQLIKVDKKFENAIEMCLGGTLQNIVTSTENDAKKAIEYLKENKLGRATFLPISSIKANPPEGKIVDEIKNSDGFCGFGSDLVKTDKDYKDIVSNLLGRVIVIDNLANGIKTAKKFNYQFKVATIEGDIINIGGPITGGSVEGRGTGILGRGREISELTEELEKIREEKNSNDKKVIEIIDEIAKLNEKMASIDSEVRKEEVLIAGEESRLNQINKNIERSSTRIDILNVEESQLKDEEIKISAEIEKFETEIVTINKEIEEIRAKVNDHQEKHKEEQTVKELLHTDITDYKISVNSIRESIDSVKESLERITGENDVSEDLINRKKNDIKKINDEIEKLRQKNTGISKVLKETDEKKTGKSNEIENIAAKREEIEQELNDNFEKTRETNDRIMLMKDELNRIEIRMEKAKSETDAIKSRMWDEYEITYSDAAAFKKDIGAIGQAQKQIAALRETIRELGPVNVSAIDDYVKTKERYEFMSGQRDDMESACEKLYKVISEMKVIMKKQFTEQFNLINSNFNAVFKELFQGGRAELVLTDKENILESGIEIEVQPPGKKLQNMMLLSGGERAFTAIALLFAILRLKPTPFCILDEIESSLDDANVYRFAEYVRGFSKKTQFVLVTHRKGTMESSDTLYGVTMQEHGISKIISMKLDEKAG